MRKQILSIVVLFSIIALVFGVASCAKTAEEIPEQVPDEVYEIRISSQMPIGHFLTDTTDLFCQRAGEMSNGPALNSPITPQGSFLPTRKWQTISSMAPWRWRLPQFPHGWSSCQEWYCITEYQN